MVNPKLDSSFNFFNFYDIKTLAAIMTTSPIIVSFIIDQAYFENDTKGIYNLSQVAYLKLHCKLHALRAHVSTCLA